MQLVTESCKLLGLSKKNYCIKTIYIQSIDDVIIWDITAGLQYIDLSTSPIVKVPVVFNGDGATFSKSSAITLYKDGGQYHVEPKYFIQTFIFSKCSHLRLLHTLEQ